MRPVLVVGLLLVVLGSVMLVRGLSLSTRRDVAQIGPITVSEQETRTLPTWTGAVAVAAGVAMVLVGGGKRRPR